MNTQINHRQMKGFTLLEVLVAAVIVIVLTAVGVSSYSSVTKKSRDARRSSDLEQVRSALEMYRSDNGYYPATGNGSWVTLSSLGSGGTNVLVPTYMAAIPVDPRGYTYQFEAMNISGGQYYGYCISGYFESGTSSNTCGTPPGTLTLPTITVGGNYYIFNYGVRQP